MTREQQLEAALRQLWLEAFSLTNNDPKLLDLFRKTDKACRELGVLPQAYSK